MLTAAQIAQLKPEARTQLFDQLCAAVFDTQVQTCESLGISSLRTLQNWRRDHSVPIMAVLAMQSIAAAPDQPSALMQDARQIAAQLEAIAEATGQTARLMASP
jgi:hypothetical protein